MEVTGNSKIVAPSLSELGENVLKEKLRAVYVMFSAPLLVLDEEVFV